MNVASTLTQIFKPKNALVLDWYYLFIADISVYKQTNK